MGDRDKDCKGKVTMAYLELTEVEAFRVLSMDRQGVLAMAYALEKLEHEEVEAEWWLKRHGVGALQTFA